MANALMQEARQRREAFERWRAEHEPPVKAEVGAMPIEDVDAEQPTKRYCELVHALGDVSLGLAELFDLITGWEPTS